MKENENDVLVEERIFPEQNPPVPLVSYTPSELDYLARLMRAEALGEGEEGMLMVGNVGVNRVIANCIEFRSITTPYSMMFAPGAFAGTKSNLFAAPSTAAERELARRALVGEAYFPATNALWFYAPRSGDNCTVTWYNQKNTGRYKGHCFYAPDAGVCPDLY